MRVDGGTAGHSGTGADDAQVGGEHHGGGGSVRDKRLVLSSVKVWRVRMAVIEVGRGTGIWLKIQVNNNKRRCLRL